MSDPFDPDAPATSDGLFGLPHGPETAAIHVLPVPFEATTSYRRGTVHGPDAIRAASSQVDLHDLAFGRPFEAGIHLTEGTTRVREWDLEASALAAPILAAGGTRGDPDLLVSLERVNAIGAELNAFVREHTEAGLDAGRLVCTLGGDHSVPFGAIEACTARHPGLGILHFDAHADLREAYEGFTWSHASILYNVLERIEGVARVVQVGIRDVGERELERIQTDPRIDTLFDREWALTRFGERSPRALVREWIAKLPREVYVTFDIDGLDPALCPNTGTPVPGGLDWHETCLWLEELAASGRRIVGLDLVEVGPGPGGDPKGQSWDAAVGARLLYKLIGSALATRG